MATRDLSDRIAELSTRDQQVIGAVLRMHGVSGQPVEAGVIRNGCMGLAYDQVHRALASLVTAGWLSKPKRGYYLPVEEGSTDVPER